MEAFGVPKILLGVRAKNLASVRDEGGDVVEDAVRLVGRRVGGGSDYCAGNDVDLEFSSERLVLGEVGLNVGGRSVFSKGGVRGYLLFLSTSLLIAVTALTKGMCRRLGFSRSSSLSLDTFTRICEPRTHWELRSNSQTKASCRARDLPSL